MTMKPTIHLNGSAGERLLEELAEAAVAIRAAMAKLGEATPNQRDYYVAPGTWEVARAWHDSKMTQLRAILVDLTATGDHIQDQLDARKR